jgi:hypothetical protein
VVRTQTPQRIAVLNSIVRAILLSIFGIFAEPICMREKFIDIDLGIFDTLDVVVAELVERQRYDPVHQPLADIVCECEVVLGCMAQIDRLLHNLEDENLRNSLAPTWRIEPERQMLALEIAFDDLRTVVTIILPQRALSLLRDQLH